MVLGALVTTLPVRVAAAVAVVAAVAAASSTGTRRLPACEHTHSCHPISNSWLTSFIFLCSDSDKAIAQGWGGDDPKRELNAEEGAIADAAAEGSGAATPANGEAAPAAEGDAPAAEAEAAPAPVEEVDNTKTLDEYLAEQAERKAKLGNNQQGPREAESWKEIGTKVEKGAEEEESFFKVPGKVSCHPLLPRYTPASGGMVAHA